MLLTLEGIDGCGKSTQIELLASWLNENGRNFSLFREPGGTEISEKIRDMLLDGPNMNPVTELLLFSAARSQLITEKVAPLLEEKELVILDRFYDSTTAYQGYGRESAALEQIHMLNQLAGHNLIPDLTIYLQIAPAEAISRLSKTKDRMERAGLAFFEKVAAGFDEISGKSGRFITLDATDKPEVIHSRIIRILESKL